MVPNNIRVELLDEEKGVFFETWARLAMLSPMAYVCQDPVPETMHITGILVNRDGPLAANLTVDERSTPDGFMVVMAQDVWKGMAIAQGRREK